MSATLVSPFCDINGVLCQQRKPRSQSVSAVAIERQLSMEQAAAVSLSRAARHGSMTLHQQQKDTIIHHQQQQQPPASSVSTAAMISFGDTSLFNRSGPQHSVNSYTANNVNVPSVRKLDRSMSEPGDRNANMPASSSKNSNINSSRYKTELCRPFEENGYCKYGDKCQFAHGDKEQRSLSRHPKYKTEPCRTFHTIGFCPYGPRCHFIHNEDERRLNAINQMKQQQAAVAQAALQQAAAQNTLQQLQSQLQQQQQLQQQVHHHQQQSPVNVGLPVHALPTHSVSSPTPVQRPSTLNFSSLASLNLGGSNMRDSLGSTADSPPSSFTDSPTMSPSFLADDLLAASMSSFAFAQCTTPPASAPAAPTRAFTFPEMALSHQQQVKPPSPTPIMTPLNVQTDPIISLAQGLQAVALNNRNNSLTSDALRDLNDSFYTPPSPPDSLNGDAGIPHASNLCDSPLDVSRSFRLPIFSQLSTTE